MRLSHWLPLFILPVLAGCSDQRATYEIQGSAHSLSLIRVTGMPWEKKAEFSIVAARMPDCMRRHKLKDAPQNAKVEVYSPGNDAWIIKQSKSLYAVETRTCEGFAKLDEAPATGLGPLVGTFKVKNDVLTFEVAKDGGEAASNEGE